MNLPRSLSCRGAFLCPFDRYFLGMSPRPRTRPKPKPRVSKPAHDATLHFLARPKQYPLTDAERADLIQVVEGYTKSARPRGRPGAGSNGCASATDGLGRRRGFNQVTGGLARRHGPGRLGLLRM